MKKIFALVLAMMLVFASVAALAEGSKVTITKAANDTATHTYEAYQIFAGVVEGSGSSAQLKQITWGNGVDVATLKTALATAFGTNTTATSKVKPGTDPAEYYTIGEIFSDAATVNTAAAYADAMGYLTSAANAELLAETIESALNNTTSGTGDNTGVSGLAPGYYIVKDRDGSLANTENGAYTKYVLRIVGADLTVTEKADVPTVDKTAEDKTGAYQETVDQKINKTFSFKVVATIPADVGLADYDTYKVNFVDTMSDGVTYEGLTSVTVNEHVIQAYDATSNPNGYKLNTTSIGANGGGSFQLGIDDILPILSANEKAAAVTITAIYTAHLNENAIVSTASDNAFDDNYNKVKLEYSNNANADGDGTGTTPEDYVWVFTFDKTNTKWADDTNTGHELAGAGFRLYSVTGTGDSATETEIPVVWNATKKAYVPAAEGATGVEMVSSSDSSILGQFNIIGLDAGSYRLKETTVPTGYNAVADIDFTIGTTHNENEGGASATMTLSNPTQHSDVIDLSGTTLPSTGGIGTTLFYIGGGILVVLAVVMLVTKRRMSSND